MIDRVLELWSQNVDMSEWYLPLFLLPTLNGLDFRAALIGSIERLLDHICKRFGLDGRAIVVLGWQGFELS